MALVDIIVPVYNTKIDLVNRCINSILKQSMHDFTLIIIDDGSKLDIACALDEIAKIDNRINVFHTTNAGVSAARNYGVKNGDSDTIAFVDADDQVTPWFLEDALAIKNKYKLDFIIGGNVFEGNDPIQLNNPVKIIGDTEIDSVIKTMISSNLKEFEAGGYIGRGPWARVISREIAEKCSFDEELRNSEDICWNIDIVRSSKRIGITNRIWYIYSLQPISATRTFNPNLMNYIENGLSGIEKRIDVNNPIQFDSYLNRIKDAIHTLSTVYINGLDQHSRDSFIKHLYTTAPWIYLTQPLGRKTSTMKMRFISILYILHLIVPYYKFKELIHSYIGKVT